MALDVQSALAAVEALNSDDAPFTVTTERTEAGGVVRATWKVWDTRWSSLLSAGHLSKDYELEVTLDAETGNYRFTERSTDVREGAGAVGDGLSANRTTSHTKGKFVVREHHAVKAPSVTWQDGTGRSWSGTFSSKTVKEPVLGALRDRGWRPKHDNWFSRLLER